MLRQLTRRAHTQVHSLLVSVSESFTEQLQQHAQDVLACSKRPLHTSAPWQQQRWPPSFQWQQLLSRQRTWNTANSAPSWQLCHGYKTAADQARARNRKGIVDGGLYLGAIVLGMIGFSYASVPLYRAFCQATGYGGTVSQTHNIEAKLKAREDRPNPSQEERAKQREIRVWFAADVADDMPWKFTPTQEYVTVHPGESVLAFFTAQNRSPHAITGVSTYNVVPDKAAYYFNKIQCFCFEEQRLRAGEEVDMPVFFYLDPELVDDHNCRNVHDITLSYTFFKVDQDEDVTAEADSAGSGIKLHGPGQLPAGVAAPPLPAALAATAGAAPLAAPAAGGT